MAVTYKEIRSLTLEEWRHTARSMPKAVFVGIKTAMDLMMPQRDGAIVNISSLKGLKATEAAPYGVRVNGVAPEQIMPPATMRFATADPERNIRVSANIPLGRGGRPEEVAQTIRLLLSNEFSCINGGCVPVDGSNLQQLYVPT